MKLISSVVLFSAALLLWSCTKTSQQEASKTAPAAAATPVYFKVDPATAGTFAGTIRFSGKKPVRKAIDMSSDPACVEANHGKVYEETLIANPNHTLANVFVYVKSGLEGKTFEAPESRVIIDQRGCWFTPHVMGIQTGQRLEVVNSDPVTHNIHPLAQINREWNHSQGQGDAPLARKFIKPEVMIPVKCNIHGWMHAYIGVLDHPYFAVTGEDGTFAIPNLPPGKYVVAAWHEKLGTQEQAISVTPSGKVEADFSFKGE